MSSVFIVNSYCPWAVKVLVCCQVLLLMEETAENYNAEGISQLLELKNLLHFPVCKEYLPILHYYHLDSCICSGYFVCFDYKGWTNYKQQWRGQLGIVLSLFCTPFLLLSKFPGKGVGHWIFQHARIGQTSCVHVCWISILMWKLYIFKVSAAS